MILMQKKNPFMVDTNLTKFGGQQDFTSHWQIVTTSTWVSKRYKRLPYEYESYI